MAARSDDKESVLRGVETTRQRSVAESFLRALKNRGIRHVFANAGTDFAPVIEGLARIGADSEEIPRFLTVPHENLAVAMAHGYYLTSGNPIAVMVHVTVGTGNTICALMNAYRDNVPLLLMAGRTPHTQTGHIASRSFHIHWGQENFDQDGMVREYTKWSYELRAGQSPDEIIGRALEVAMAEPRGPVYLTLPREILANIDELPLAGAHARTAVSPAQPDAGYVLEAAELIAAAELPVIVTSNLGRDLAAVDCLAALTEEFAIPVTQAQPTCVNLPASHPMNMGQGGGGLLAKSDLIIVADCEVPWFPRNFTPKDGAKVVHLGIDPLWTRYPIRIFPTDLAIPGNTLSSLRLLADSLRSLDVNQKAIAARRSSAAAYKAKLTAAAEDRLAVARSAKPVSYDYLGDCVRQALPEGAIVVTELGASPDRLALEEPGSFIGVGIGGGLGFGLGASLGAKIAAPERTVITTLGDGSYMFGNPTPFHFVSRAIGAPTLTIVCNNGRWHAVDASTRGVYPDGVAATAGEMPLVELQPTPEFSKVGEASGAYARRIDDPADLPGAIERSLEAIAGGQQALLDVRMERDKH